jgi:hypothetical protein
MSKRRPQPDDELMRELFAIAEALYRPGPEREAAAARFGELYDEYGAPGRFELLSPDTASFLLNVAYRIAMKTGMPAQARDLALRFFTHPHAESAVVQDEQQFMRYLGATATFRCGADSEALAVIRPVLEQGRLPYQRGALYTVRAVLLEYCEFHVDHPEKVISEDFAAFAEEVFRRLKRSKSTRRRLPEPATVRDVYELMDSTYPEGRPGGAEIEADPS